MKPHITSITIARLHNLGNYEHTRYEVTVALPPESNAGAVLAQLEGLLEDIDPKPPRTNTEIMNARLSLEKPVEEWPEWQRDNKPHYEQIINEMDAWRAKREDALQRLSNLGLQSTYTDAKDHWDDQ